MRGPDPHGVCRPLGSAPVEPLARVSSTAAVEEDLVRPSCQASYVIPAFLDEALEHRRQNLEASLGVDQEQACVPDLMARFVRDQPADRAARTHNGVDPAGEPGWNRQ